jgi:SpoIID/LytB domain protein
MAVNGLYDLPFLYAATGVLVAHDAPIVTAPAEAVPAAPAPVTAPSATPEPTPTPTAAPPAPAATPVTDTVFATACSGVNLRTSASTSGTIKVKLAIASSVTVSGTVDGSSWSTICPTAKSGSAWYVVTGVNGEAVGTSYGVPALYAASGVLTALAGSASTVAPAPAAAPPLIATDPVGTATTVSAVTSAPALGPVTTFYGRGYGHGVGFSQYGARGRALAGQLAPEILAHYYAGTAIASIAPDAAIRVLLLDNFVPTGVKPLTIYGRGGPWTFAELGIEFPADARLQLFLPASPGELPRAVVDLAGTQLLYDGPVALDFRIRGTADGTVIQVYSKPSIYDQFRGSLRVIVSGGALDVVNELPLETYLRGVLAAEMPNAWPLEARIAQAIVARSYAAYQLHPGWGTFDVYDDTRSQVYLGVKQERPDADAVIASTAGQVLMSGFSIVNALFHSTAGGATENNENVFVSPTGARIATPMSYLRGSPDRDPTGVSYDAGAPSATWQTRAYTADELSAIFAKDTRTNVGTLTGLDLRNRGVSGRLISVTLIGTVGTRTVSGTVFAAAFNAGRATTDAAIRGTLLDVAPIP